MSRERLAEVCDILNINTGLSDDEKRTAVRSALSLGYDEYEADKFVGWYKALGSGFGVTVNGFSVKLKGIDAENNFELLGETMKQLEYYLPPFESVMLAGDGLTFDECDALDMQFEELEELRAPFSVLETL